MDHCAAPAAARRPDPRARGRRPGRLLAECSNLARELANEPGNHNAARIRAASRPRLPARGRRQCRDPRRRSHRATRDGLAARCGARQQRAAAADGLSARSARRPCRTSPRARRKRHHVRHGRHLDQARRRHGADERRHGGRRGGGLRHAGHLSAAGADPRRRRRAGDGEHAGGPGDQAGRHSEAQRQDGRGDQHRCRRGG